MVLVANPVRGPASRRAQVPQSTAIFLPPPKSPRQDGEPSTANNRVAGLASAASFPENVPTGRNLHCIVPELFPGHPFFAQGVVSTSYQNIGTGP